MKTHNTQEMFDKLDKYTEQYEFLKKTLDMDFILFLDIVSKKGGADFITNLIKFLKKNTQKLEQQAL